MPKTTPEQSDWPAYRHPFDHLKDMSSQESRYRTSVLEILRFGAAFGKSVEEIVADIRAEASEER
jgi:hypothetical protein